MQLFKKKKTQEEKLIEENTALRAKIHAKFGDNIPYYISPTVSPDMQNAALKNIWHALNNPAPTRIMKICDYLESPAYPNIQELSESEIKGALPRMITLLKSHKILLTGIETLEPAEIYRFIVEDVLPLEIETYSLKHQPYTLDYQDLYPDYAEELEEELEFVLIELMHSPESFLSDFLIVSDQYAWNSEIKNEEDLFAKLDAFREKHELLEIQEIILHEIEIKKEAASLEYSIWYKAQAKNETEIQDIRGKGRFDFILYKGGYEIQKMSIPGVLQSENENENENEDGNQDGNVDENED